MRYILILLFAAGMIHNGNAQTPESYSSADILQEMKKLPVFGSVLYIAAHPDDENTKLLAYLANEKRYRTGYLSLTRGDGGQNLIGDDQGIDLGLIRTQELLSARRIDGAEQFFSRAYDFGFSKSPEEALRIWGHDKILSDVIWVIRKFKPDVIITRFPTTGEGGHGHHTASAILAGEAFEAAADSTKFPEQFQYGVTTWQAKRLLWNTFNFGGNNTTREGQLKIDCGTYNPILGKSYGEIAAESRSQHKSQGFGVPAQRGASIEYFATIKGDKPATDIMDRIDVSGGRIFEREQDRKTYEALAQKIIQNYDASAPQRSIPGLQVLQTFLSDKGKSNIAQYALINRLVLLCSGIFMEATASQQFNALGDSMRVTLLLNNRTGVTVSSARVSFMGSMYVFKDIRPDENKVISATIKLSPSDAVSQPYWLEHDLADGAFDIRNQAMIGRSEGDVPVAVFRVSINDQGYDFVTPVRYKYTDPVRGEIYEPVQIIHSTFVNSAPSLIIFPDNSRHAQRNIEFSIQPNVAFNGKAAFNVKIDKKVLPVFDSVVTLNKGDKKLVDFSLSSDLFPANSTSYVTGSYRLDGAAVPEEQALKQIHYDHIPDVFYNYYDKTKVLKMDLRIVGKLAGYIPGAGDKIPECLQQMGYTVVTLGEHDLVADKLSQYDVIITGVRAYNIHDWLNDSYAALMKYIYDGGVLLVQYNTNNSIGPVKAKIAPYPFTISRNRITDETAKVNFLLPADSSLNYPNKITGKDFEGWIQERSTYHAEAADPHYKKIFSMKDPGEKEQDGSLLIAGYGKGRFIYSGLVFFRELPAAVPGAYRLFANLIANEKK